MRMPRNWAIRISDKITAYANDPAGQANNVTALQGVDGLSRLRVGDWRVIMRDHVVLEVLDIKSRGSAYKD
jgi:mRNA interferase RelE/StbE